MTRQGSAGDSLLFSARASLEAAAPSCGKKVNCPRTSDPDTRVFASAVSAYEMSLKHHRGRWPEVEPLVGAFEEVLAAERFDLLPLSAKHAIRADAYGPEHRDAFDRMLAAQAVVEGLALVSKDSALRELGAEVVWG